jgi:hypothetical protein
VDIPIDIPPGLNSDDTTYASAPAWADGSHVRFRLGRPQTCGGWESITADLLTGVCRAVLAWTQNDAALNIAAGTHSNLQLWQGGAIYDLTPYGPVTPLGANPLSVTNASAVVTVAHAAHGYATGQSLAISGAAAIGGITPNGVFTITVTGADSYTYAFSSPATSTVANAGGSTVVVTPQSTLPAGNVDGTSSNGYGVGGYGVGGWGQPSTADYFPRTWSLQAWGQKLLASPRGGGLYEWSNATATRALAITTAPARITQMLVSPQRQVFALGCTQENGIWNPACLRHSSVEDNTTWQTNVTSASTAREYILPGGGRIVGGKFLGRYLLVWTTQSLFLGTYVGQVGQVWRFDKVGDKCGLIGPNAAAALGSTVFWISPDRQFHSYSTGGAVTPVACPIRADFAQNLAASQADKIMASTIGEFSEVRWDYPDTRDGYEVSRYLALAADGPDAGAWYRGNPTNGVIPARTAMVDAGPAPNPIGISADGHVYWQELGHSADGQALPWFIRSAEVYLDENRAALVRQAWPDISLDQIGPVQLALSSRLHPQGAQTHFGPFTLMPGQETIDFKASGRLFQLTYSGFSLPSYARIGRLVVDASPRGRKG